MSYYHVLITTDTFIDKPKCVLTDLSERALKKSFLKPYMQGRRILCGNEIYDSLAVRSVIIIETSRTIEIELNEANEKDLREISWRNREDPGFVFFSLGIGTKPEDISCIGMDVTNKFITAPPGQAGFGGKILAFIYNPWVITVVGGLIVILLAWWLGWGQNGALTNNGSAPIH